jgi:hypothetical protein
MKKLMLIISLLSVLAITNAQVDESEILDTDFVQKNELRMTPEITEMVVSMVDSAYKNNSDEDLSRYGIKSRSQLKNLQLGKPIPWYRIENENLKFIGIWYVPIMSDGEPLLLARVRLADDGEYIFLGAGAAKKAERIHNYEYKDMIIGYLDTKLHRGNAYFYIRKENKDTFVQVYDYPTREYFQYEYSFSELINLLKK